MASAAACHWYSMYEQTEPLTTVAGSEGGFVATCTAEVQQEHV